MAPQWYTFLLTILSIAIYMKCYKLLVPKVSLDSAQNSESYIMMYFYKTNVSFLKYFYIRTLSLKC